MTAQSSTGNFSKFGTYFLYKLRTMRPLIILNSIFALLSYPTALTLMAVYGNISERMDNIRNEFHFESSLYYENPEYIRLSSLCDTLEGITIAACVIGFIMLMLMFFMNYVLPAKAFRWLYDKTVVDMDYSLPVSDDTRFFGDLLSSLAGTLVPHLIAVVIGSILIRLVPVDAELENVVGSIFDQLAYTGIVSCVMFTAISLFVMSLCGRTAEARLYPFVINAAIPIIHIVCMVIVLSNAYGYTNSGTVSEYISVAATSPLGLIGISFMYAMAGDFYYVDAYTNELQAQFTAPMLQAEVLIPLVIVTLGCFAASYFLIKYRRAERVGSPYVFNIVKVIIPAVVTFAVTCCFSAFIFPAIKELTEGEMNGYSYSPRPEGFITAWLITTFVMFVIMELISGKGFKRFYMTLLKYVVTTAASFGICAVLFYSNGLGIAQYTPAANDVVEAHIWVWSNNNDNGHLTGTVTSTEEIQKIIDYHKDIPKDKAETNDVTYEFNVDYIMKNGSTVSRCYNVPKERYDRALNTLFSPELYCSRIMPDELLDWQSEEYSDREMIIYGVTVGNGSYQDIRIDPDELAAAIRSDCELATVERVYGGADGGTNFVSVEFRHNDVPMYSSSSYMTFYMAVYPWYENTIALLESKGVTGLFERDLDKFNSCFILEYDAVGVDYDLMYASNSTPDVQELFEITSGYPTEYEYAEVRRVPMDSAALEELISISGSNYAGIYTSQTMYKLVLTDSVSRYDSYNWYAEYIVTEENLDRAAEIFDSLAV